MNNPTPPPAPAEPSPPEPTEANTPRVLAPEHHAAIQRYWRTNILVMAVLLSVWALVGLGCGVLFAGYLNQFAPFGVPLGFWFAQQGSIFTFVVIILVYALVMNRLDANFHKQREAQGWA